jgi:hypothetical protein
MPVHTHSFHFPEIRYGCLKGNKCAHAAGIDVTYFQGIPRPTVDIESINSTGAITTNCKIPLPNDPTVLRELGAYLETLAKEIETNG